MLLAGIWERPLVRSSESMGQQSKYGALTNTLPLSLSTSVRVATLTLGGVGGSHAKPNLIDGNGTNDVGAARRTLTIVDCVSWCTVQNPLDGRLVEPLSS